MNDLIDRGAPLAEVAAWLDARTHAERVRATRALSRSRQRALFALAAAGAPLTLDDFARDATPVAHVGWNSLPLPGFGRRFTKWMARRPDGQIVGYNASWFQVPIGPGYFALRETRPDEFPDSAVVVDYHLRVRGPVAAGWPTPRPNWVGLQALVYLHTRDYLRRVSRHVTIGAATKYGWWLGSFFVLVRDDGTDVAPDPSLR